MGRVRAWAFRLRGMLRKTQSDAELSAELESHLQPHIDENVRAGMTPDAARRDALIRLGGVEQTKEAYRDRRGLPWLDALLQDLRFATRMLRKNPGFTAVAVLTLALGIGANTAIFSLVNALMLHEVSVRDPGALVELLHRYPGEPAFNGFFWDAYQVLRQNHVLSDLIVDKADHFAIRGAMLEPHTVLGGFLSGTFFETLGLQPAIGRLIGSKADDLSHLSPVAVVSWAFWRRNFNLDPQILGQEIIVNDTPVTIIGVGQQGFGGLNEEMSREVWLPLSMEPVIHGASLGWGWNGLDLIGRLRPGVSLEKARTELAVLFQSAIQAPDVGPFVREMKFELHPAAGGLSSPIREMLRTPVLVLMTITSLALLMACANLAGLLLARGAARRHEMALRVCLGAGRLRFVRQVLTESLLLSVFGSLPGLFLAYFGGRWLLPPVVVHRRGIQGSGPPRDASTMRC